MIHKARLTTVICLGSDRRKQRSASCNCDWRQRSVKKLPVMGHWDEVMQSYLLSSLSLAFIEAEWS